MFVEHQQSPETASSVGATCLLSCVIFTAIFDISLLWSFAMFVVAFYKHPAPIGAYDWLTEKLAFIAGIDSKTIRTLFHL